MSEQDAVVGSVVVKGGKAITLCTSRDATVLDMSVFASDGSGDIKVHLFGPAGGGTAFVSLETLDAMVAEMHRQHDKLADGEVE